MKKIPKKERGAVLFVVIASTLALGGFLYQAGIMYNPLFLAAISLFLLIPYRNDSPLIKRLLTLIVLLIVYWIVLKVGTSIMPFIIAFLMAYLADPVVRYLEKKKIKRWVSALAVDFVLFGIITTVAIFLLPLIFSQLEDVLQRVSSIVGAYSTYFDKDSFYATMGSFGFNETEVRTFVNSDMIPKIEEIVSDVVGALLSVLTQLSALAKQLFNVILIPVLFFYFLKDYRKISDYTKEFLKEKNGKLINDLDRIGNILRRYISWQIVAAFIVAVFTTLFFWIFGIPYPIVLGLLCGFMNPIPYLGIFVSMIIGILVSLIVQPNDIAANIVIISSVVGAVHFINAYIIEPKVVGKLIGLHPLVLIGSLFVFGNMFGIFGLLIAVPLTGVLMMFFHDWINAKMPYLNNLATIQNDSEKVEVNDVETNE